ncbi:MAG: carboxyl transferase, partial [Clostridia bacterium]|nr:carboxyl transferase [Clostridia bacterium]
MSTDRKVMTRIWKLADEGSFVEFGRNVAQRSTDFTSDTEKPAGDGAITGTASVNGVTVAVYAQDAETLGGSLGEMHARKIEAVYEFALKAACPVIGLLDSAGIRLSEATDALEGLGRIYSVMAKASGRVPTVLALFGRTGGGMAVMAGLADFVFMSKDAELFVNAPNTLDGNYREKCDTASADYQAEESGTADFTGTEDEVLGKIQELFWMLPANADDRPFQESGDDLNRTTEELSGEIDVRKILTTLSDDLVFTELK